MPARKKGKRKKRLYLDGERRKEDVSTVSFSCADFRSCLTLPRLKDCPLGGRRGRLSPLFTVGFSPSLSHRLRTNQIMPSADREIGRKTSNQHYHATTEKTNRGGEGESFLSCLSVRGAREREQRDIAIAFWSTIRFSPSSNLC